MKLVKELMNAMLLLAVNDMEIPNGGFQKFRNFPIVTYNALIPITYCCF